VLEEYQAILWWSFAASVALFVLTPLAVLWIVVRLPVDYFAAKRRPRDEGPLPSGLRPVVIVVKNLVGALLVVAGLVMLVVPGQGLLTIVVGLMLLDFPGKYRLERWLATRSQVWRSINWLRRRAGHEELQRPE
jgi:hypothetical protein